MRKTWIEESFFMNRNERKSKLRIKLRFNIKMMTISSEISFHVNGAKGETRTLTGFPYWYLKPARLPIPPLSLMWAV